MRWNNYTVEAQYKNKPLAEQPRAYTVRAVSLKHALTKVTARYPDAQQHEATKCRCGDIDDDMCDACYLLHFRG